MTDNQFSSIAISPAQLTNLDSLGYHTMTPIQAKGLPVVLEGKDLMANAKTGSGKTATFGIGLLEHINPRFFGVQALILCPTRELADQVSKELRKLARSTANIKLVVLCGGKPSSIQKASLKNGAHIIVGTPGRVYDHLERGTLDLDGLKTLVLDEADKMLDMGFADSVNDVISYAPVKRQTLLFSATFPDAVRKMGQHILNEPVTVSVDVEHDDSVIQQTFYRVTHENREQTLLRLFATYQPKTSVIFCHTKIQCDEVAEYLRSHKVEAQAMHGDFEQYDRDRVLVQFANNSCPVLVATDVAARGLDIKSLELVINFELPRDPEIYIHRIGRTGRAGEEGKALNLFTDNEKQRVKSIENYLNKPVVIEKTNDLSPPSKFSLYAPMTTLLIDVGRKSKVRAGDILGALTRDAKLVGAQIGKIDIFDTFSYVAFEHEIAKEALQYLNSEQGKIKGRSVKARRA